MDKERKAPPKAILSRPVYKNIEEEQGLVRLGLILNL
jgi:hypothetical protein